MEFSELDVCRTGVKNCMLAFIFVSSLLNYSFFISINIEVINLPKFPGKKLR